MYLAEILTNDAMYDLDADDEYLLEACTQIYLNQLACECDFSESDSEPELHVGYVSMNSHIYDPELLTQKMKLN